MRYKINLIANVNKQTQQAKQTATRANMVSICAVLILFLSAVGIFLLKNYYAANDLKQQEQDLISTLSSMHAKVVKSDLVEDRITNVNTILSKRFPLDTTISQLISVAPSDISITNFSIDKKNVTITVNAASLASLDSFFASLASYVGQKQSFSDVTLVSLTSQGASGYTAALTLTIL